MAQSSDEVEKKLRAEAIKESPLKKHKASPIEQEPQPMVHQYHKSQYGLMKSTIIDAFDKGEKASYKKLKQMFDSFPANDPVVLGFFKEHGRFIFRHALLRTRDDKALLFLAEHMPRDILWEVLRRDDFSAIRNFLVGEAGYERRGLAKPENFVEQRIKFKALLKIDPAVREYMEGADIKKYATENTLSTFEEAKIESRAGLSLTR